MQLKINDCKDIIFEWIPYNQFDGINETGNFTISHSVIWKDGPLCWNYWKYKYTRNSANKAITLRYLYNLQDITSESLNEV